MNAVNILLNILKRNMAAKLQRGNHVSGDTYKTCVYGRINLTIIQQKRGMEMFDFFKKKEKGIEIGSPVKGKTVAISNVSDPTFGEEI